MFFAEDKYIKYFQNSNGVKQEEDNEPEFIVIFCRFPKRHPFPWNDPNGGEDENP